MKTPIILMVSALWANLGMSEGQVPQRARKTPITLSRTPGPSARERTDYGACRKTALDAAKKQGAANPKDFARWQLAQCRDLFPGTAQYVECKRDVVRGTKDKNKIAEDLAKCRTDYQKLAFDPNAELPFSIEKGRAYFAGAGLNIPRRVFNPDEQKDLAAVRRNSFGSFTCSPIENALFSKGEDEFLLFGNFLTAFKGLNEKSKTELLQLLDLEPSKKKGATKRKASPGYQVHPMLGQIFGIDTKQPLTAYFPTSHCYYDGDTGKLYAGLKVYYLLDKMKKTITPYFGTAFYRPESAPPLDELVAKTAAALGEGYTVQSKKEGVIYIAKGELQEFDYEGDPLNLCRGREHEYIAVIKADNTQKTPEYLVLSNISNLCKYGNRLADSLTAAAIARKGSKPSPN